MPLGSFWRFNPLNVKFAKWSNTLKQFFGKLPTNCLSAFDHFVGLILKGLSFKIPDLKENVEHSQTERVKDAINKENFLRTMEVEVEVLGNWSFILGLWY